MTKAATGPLIIAVDVETTGLDASTDELIEIGAVAHYIGGETASSFQELIRPSKPISPFITEKTGITNEMVRNCRSEGEVLSSFIEWCGDYERVLVAHNAPFDAEFLAEAAKRHNLSIPRGWSVIDTLRWSRSRIKVVANYQLGTLLKNIRFKPPGQLHRALADANGVAALVDYLWGTYKTPLSALKGQAIPFGQMASPEPATERQLSYLADLGASSRELEGLTKRQASKLIDRYKSNQPLGRGGSSREPKKKQSSCLKQVAIGCAVLFALAFFFFACVALVG